VSLIETMGLNSYRFSISWSRILPRGTGDINQHGVQYYNNLIDKLIENGVEPIVTIYHWDLPLKLHKKYGGWISSDIIDDFTYFAKTCFKLFGDRVKYWITFNEPWTFAYLGYVTGTHAPGRCSDRSRCSEGNSSTEGYIVAHNVLLSHANVVELYRTYFQPQQSGVIGITLNHDWNIPWNISSQDDIQAAERMNIFLIAWFADPIAYGEYPRIMREFVGDRLPKFTDDERAQLIGSYDFWGLNHYSTRYVRYKPRDAQGEKNNLKRIS
jgi:beta-glucosidase